MKIFSVLLVSVLLLAALPVFSSVAHAQDPLCIGYGDGGGLHHTPSPWLEQALYSGSFQAYRFGTSLILAFQVAACGGAWMFAKFNAGSFTTNFIPSRGWSYVAQQIRASRAVRVRASIVSTAYRALSLGFSMETMLFMIVLPDMRSICRYLPTVAMYMPECNQA